MRSLGKLAMCGLVAVGMIGFISTPAQAQEDERTFTAIAKSGSDADKTIARAQTVTKVIEKILADWSFSAIRGERRKKLVHNIFDILRNERFKERRSRWRYRAKVSMSEARNRVLDALEVENTFGSDQFIIVAYAKDWFYGGGLSQREIKVLHQAVVAGCSDYMNSHRFRESPAANNREKVNQAAVSLGADPTTSQMKDFAMMFQAPLVVSIKGNIKFEKYPAGTPQARQFRGYLRCQGVKARMYDKNSDTILAQFTLRADKRYRNVKDMNAYRMHCPWVSKVDSLSEETEKYAQDIGKMLAVNIMKRLFDRFYAGVKYPEPVVKASPRDCPGCGDKIIDGQIKECPACESPLPAPKMTSVPGTGNGRRAPNVRDHYKLRFKGWDDSDVGEIIEALEENEDFANWKDKGQMGVFHVYECTYVGNLIVRAVNDALEDAGKKDNAKVTKTGNNVNILNRQ